MRRARLLLLATGGTIAGLARGRGDADYAAAALDADALGRAVPGLSALADVEVRAQAAIDSCNATPAFWQSLGRAAEAALAEPDCDGLVITHGTDTLEETAYYLHLALGATKPVVLTGAMRPADAPSADGPRNLLDAVATAASPEAAGRGVLVTMNRRVFGARDVVKRHSTALEAFGAPSGGPLGIVADEAVAWRARPERPHTRACPFGVATPLPPVDILYGYAGTPAALVDAVRAGGARGIVWAGTGNGSVPQALRPALEAARRAGLALVRATRCGDGAVLPRADDRVHGWTSAGDLPPAKARVLCMLALGAGGAADSLQRCFDTY